MVDGLPPLILTFYKSLPFKEKAQKNQWQAAAFDRWKTIDQDTK